jgi:hypothetical protein
VDGRAASTDAILAGFAVPVDIASMMTIGSVGTGVRTYTRACRTGDVPYGKGRRTTYVGSCRPEALSGFRSHVCERGEMKTHGCVVPGCAAPGRNQIGVRCRIAHSGESPFPGKSRTYAIFSVESDAFLCDTHALGGVSLALAVSPSASEEASLAVISGTTMTEVRTVEIKQPQTRLRRAA